MESQDDNHDIPCNQEQVTSIPDSDEQFDYNLDLTNLELPSSDKETNQDNPWVDLLSDAVNSFETALTSKHSIACARESLSYAIVSGKLPPFMRWQLECRPNLWISKEFQELWKTKTNTIRDKVLKSSVEFMDNKIGLAYYKLREIQENTLNAIKNPP